MVLFPVLFFATAACVAALSMVDAHGNMKAPKAEILPGKPQVEWVVTLKPAWPWEGTSGSWKGGDQAGMYAKLAKKNGFSTLRSYLDDKGAECGYTDPKAAPKPIPADGNVVFTAFTHQGPCEIWLDDKMAFHDDNCEAHYAGKGVELSKMPVDFSPCTTGCMVRFYWLGFQNEQWQVYKNCAPVAGTGGSTTTKAPVAITKAPAATTKAPAATTKAPAATEKPGCKRRLRN